MEVHFTPELEGTLNELALATGREKADLIQDAITRYFEDLAVVRSMLDDSL